jgi:hypothetical protein
MKIMGKNLPIPSEDLAFIRSLGDFDLLMLLSEINDHGWVVAKRTLEMIRESVQKEKNNDELRN